MADGGRLSLQQALVLLLGGAVIAGVVPAGVILNYRAAAELERRTREDLARAPRVVENRTAALASALMMHAKELAAAPPIVAAMARDERDAAVRLTAQGAAAFGELPIVIDASERRLAGPPISATLIDATRRGEMPTAIVAADSGIARISIAAVLLNGRWIGAVGSAAPMGAAEAGLLAGLTRAAVTIVRTDGEVVATTGSAELARAVADSWPSDDSTVDIEAGGHRFLASRAVLDGAGMIVFTRDRAEELALVPHLRRIVVASAIATLLLALLVGVIVARWIAQPVEALAVAANEVASGRFASPIPSSAIREVSQVGRAFDAMRQALAARLDELEGANRALAERQHRLAVLQGELMQRERVAATGRLLGSLAHEIRNPVANVRNCLEVVRRRLPEGEPNGQTREFVDLAIDELLRMHELAEQMLDVNRPRDRTATHCDAAAVARNLATLMATPDGNGFTIETSGASTLDVPLSPDQLTQVLLNLVQNAQEAGASRVEIGLIDRSDLAVVEVEDDGPGIASDVRSRIFDPFYTTKGDMRGAGLGLFVAEGIVRGAGGRITAGPRADERRGECMRLEFPVVGDRVAAGTS